MMNALYTVRQMIIDERKRGRQVFRVDLPPGVWDDILKDLDARWPNVDVREMTFCGVRVRVWDGLSRIAVVSA